MRYERGTAQAIARERHMAHDRLKPALDTELPGCLWLLEVDARGYATPGGDLESLGAAGEGFVWLHLDLADVRARGVIERLRRLPQDARASLVEPLDHQFLETDGVLLFGALLDHERDLGGPTSQTDYMRFICGDNYLVTARRRPLCAVETTWLALSAGQLAPTPLALLELLIEHLCEQLADMTVKLGRTLDIAEDQIIDGRSREARRALGPARRSAVRLARQIGGLNSILARLEKSAAGSEQEELRDAAGRLAQRADALLRDVTSIQDRARLLQEELNALLNLETNDRLYVLTVVTTLLLPATFVTGYFGMNTRQLLFSENDNGTLYATILCVAASALVLFIMRRMGLTRRDNVERGQKKKGSTPDVTESF